MEGGSISPDFLVSVVIFLEGFLISSSMYDFELICFY